MEDFWLQEEMAFDKCWCRREILAPLISLTVDKYVAVSAQLMTNINTTGLHFASL